MIIHLPVGSDTVQDSTYVHKIDSIIRNVGLDDFLEQSLHKILQIEESSIRSRLNIVEAELRIYETKYELSSGEFLKRFNRGELDDRTDFLDWYALVDTKERLLSTLVVVKE